MSDFDKAVLDVLSRNSGQVMVALGDDLVQDIHSIFRAHYLVRMKEEIIIQLRNAKVMTRDDTIRRVATEASEKIVREGMAKIFKDGA